MSKQQIIITESTQKKARKQLLTIGDGKIGRELFHLIKGQYRVVYVRSPEERRVIKTFKLISQSEGYDLFQWDLSRGLIDAFTMENIKSDHNEVNDNAEALLDHIIDHAKADNEKINKEKDDQVQASGGHIYLLLDFHHFLDGSPLVERKIKEFSGFSSICHIVIISPIFTCPPALDKELTLIDFPCPSKQEIEESLDKICKGIAVKFPKASATGKKRKEELIKAATGLTIAEVENAYCKSLVRTKTFDIPTILEEKKQIIRKGGILECRDPQFTFDDIGGLDSLKEWLQMRKLALKEDAREFGIDNLKGVLLTGIPGVGKSCSADAVASLYEMPLVRLDIGALFSAHVGESEAHTRDAIQMVEAISPVVCWLDEIEKGIGGVQSSNMTDGGVTNRVFGTLLTWMQEKTAAVFVVATVNNILSIPPEFMRAGRFDEVFFLDLPNEEQRVDVLQCLLKKKKRKPTDFDLVQISKASDHYSPAELEKGINNALFVAFSENKRELATDDIISEIQKFQPLYNSRREEVEEMREWALGKDGSSGRARLANTPPKPKSHATKNIGRQIDLSSDDL